MTPLWCVTWMVLVQAGCPATPHNAYGRVSGQTTALLCVQQERHSKAFNSQKEAEKFVADAHPQSEPLFTLEDVAEFQVLETTGVCR